tara:strand:+ start:5107 stop:5652 length:546 start_codon:yes stop_codon:yes gene_type:complete
MNSDSATGDTHSGNTIEGKGGKVSARLYRVLSAAVFGMRGAGGIKVKRHPAGYVIDGSKLQAGPNGSFKQTRGGTYGELVGLSDGFLNVHGITQQYIAATDIVLAGGPFVFVYLWALASDYSTNGIAVSGGATAEDIPLSGSGRFNIVLWQYELNGLTGAYGNPIARAGGQDINIMTPVRN